MTKKDIINKIINQANSLNKKIKSFKSEGIVDHYDFITAMFNDEQMKYNKSGSMTKSKKFYEKQNILQLKRTLSTITKINNHDVFGTINKYQSKVTEKWTTLTHTVEEYLLDKGYAIDQVKMITTSDNFIRTLSVALNNIEKGFGSKQVIEKTFLNYAQYSMDDEDVRKAVSDLEYGASKVRQIEDMNERFQRFLQMENEERGRR